MDKRTILSKVKKIYSEGKNMMLYLNNNTHRNSVEDIMISYDFQAGEIVADFLRKGDAYQFAICKIEELLKVVRDLGINLGETVLEAGVGDGTFLASMMKRKLFKVGYGFDISFSRLLAGRYYSEKIGEGENIHFFSGDLFHIPIADNMFDTVYTVGAVQLNTDREKEILQELYRVTGKWLILMEASYDLGTEAAREHMEEHGFSKNIYKCVQELGYNVKYYRLLSDKCCPETDPEALIIIKKEGTRDNDTNPCEIWQCPVTGAPLREYKDSFWSEDSLLAYPKIKGIPILLEASGIVATKYSDFNV